MGSFGHVQGGIFMLKRALVCFLILSGWFWFGGPSAHADQAAAPASFTVTPVLPRDNASHIAYFQFPVHPREHRTLSLRVTNQSQQLGAYAVVPRVAGTNTNGTLDYSIGNHLAQLPAQAATLFAPSQRHVTVPAHTSRLVDFQLTAPKQSFKGIMLTGFTVSQINDSQHTQAAKHRTAGIVARTNYVVACEFYNHRLSQLLPPNITFKGGQYRLVNGQPQLALGMFNHTAELVGQGQLTAKLQQATGKTVAKFDQRPLTLAPQSRFNLNLAPQQHQLAAGKYTLTGNLSTQGGFTFPFTVPVTITPQQAQSVKQHIASLGPKKPVNWLLIGLIVLISVVLVLLALNLYALRGHRLPWAQPQLRHHLKG